MTVAHEELLPEIQQLARTAPSPTSFIEQMCKHLHEKVSHYNWVGVYFIDPADSACLLLGPFVGSFTPNLRIPFHTGLCGAAATTEQTVVVGDVSKDLRYLLMGDIVKSEIAVPIFAKQKLAGVFNVESYFADTFTRAEQDFVETCAALIGESLGKG